MRAKVPDDVVLALDRAAQVGLQPVKHLLRLGNLRGLDKVAHGSNRMRHPPAVANF
jgi:hypothetical protein